MDNRQGFPLLYDTHHTLHLEDLPFWIEISARGSDPILELGCGTGRVTLPLPKAGRQVFGLDNDPWMRRLLRQKLVKHRRVESPELAIQVFQADMVAFHTWHGVSQPYFCLVIP